ERQQDDAVNRQRHPGFKAKASHKSNIDRQPPLGFCASWRSLASSFRCAAPIAARSSSKVTFAPSLMKLIIPPAAVKPSLLPTVRIGFPLTAAITAAAWLASLMKMMWHVSPPVAPLNFLTAISRPLAFLPATFLAK